MDKNSGRALENAIPERTSERLSTSRWQVSFIIFIILAIGICEYIFTYQNVTYGIIIALSLTLVIYFMVSVLKMTPGITNSAESLALVPLYILFTSSLPWFLIDQQYLLPLVYSCVLGLCLWHTYQ
ncbi:hypothetical protein ACFLTT_03775, partial [Chloroflexota bacterium]